MNAEETLMEIGARTQDATDTLAAVRYISEVLKDIEINDLIAATLLPPNLDEYLEYLEQHYAPDTFQGSTIPISEAVEIIFDVPAADCMKIQLYISAVMMKHVQTKEPAVVVATPVALEIAKVYIVTAYLRAVKSFMKERLILKRISDQLIQSLRDRKILIKESSELVH